MKMPRGKKRSASDIMDGQRGTTKSPRTISHMLSSPSCRLESQGFSPKKCLNWFKEYTTADDPNTLDPEGMERLCEDIGVEPENVVMLVLAWKMGARQMGYFTQQEWLYGLSQLQCDSADKLRGRLEYLRSLLNDAMSFKAIYRYAFDFARDKNQKSLDLETGKRMLMLVLGMRWHLYSKFQAFLDQSRYKVVNRDQWNNILEFSRSILPDLSNYDVDGAWPVMLDEFAEWMQQSNNFEGR